VKLSMIVLSRDSDKLEKCDDEDDDDDADDKMR